MVAQEAGHRFIVDTPQALVEVLGTCFEVRVAGKTTRVEVREGAVGVTAKSDSTKRRVPAGTYVDIVAGSPPAVMSLPDWILDSNYVEGPIVYQADLVDRRARRQPGGLLWGKEGLYLSLRYRWHTSFGFDPVRVKRNSFGVETVAELGVVGTVGNLGLSERRDGRAQPGGGDDYG